MKMPSFRIAPSALVTPNIMAVVKLFVARSYEHQAKREKKTGFTGQQLKGMRTRNGVGRPPRSKK